MSAFEHQPERSCKAEDGDDLYHRQELPAEVAQSFAELLDKYGHTIRPEENRHYETNQQIGSIEAIEANIVLARAIYRLVPPQTTVDYIATTDEGATFHLSGSRHKADIMITRDAWNQDDIGPDATMFASFSIELLDNDGETARQMHYNVLDVGGDWGYAEALYDLMTDIESHGGRVVDAEEGYFVATVLQQVYNALEL
jgi:hypothetical protein